MKKKEWDGAFVDLSVNMNVPDRSVLKVLEEILSPQMVCFHMIAAQIL